jgi:hypothetical protein
MRRAGVIAAGAAVVTHHRRADRRDDRRDDRQDDRRDDRR